MARACVSVLLFVLAWLGTSAEAWALSFERYHSQDEINAYMRDLARTYPTLVRQHQLGYSERGREINYVVLSKHDPAGLPAIYLNGTHHGNEKASTEAVLALIDFLVAKRNDPDVGSILGTYALYVQPLVNPDGHAENTRGDAYGRDPNRDYADFEHPTEESFRSQPIRLVKELVDKVRFRAAAAFHAGMEGVLWPWGYTANRSNDYDLFYTLSKITAQAMRMTKYTQSFLDYPTKGEFIDYVYNTHGTLALTVEVSGEGTPPASMLDQVVKRSIAGSMAFLLSVQELDLGKFEVQRAPDPAALARSLQRQSTRVE